MDEPRLPVVSNPWRQLRQFTPARIALGRAGISLPTQPNLEFQLAHARARDAVHHRLAIEPLAAELKRRGQELIVLQSAAPDRALYLQRPDLGRRLATDSRQRLEEFTDKAPGGFDAAFVIADGLSAFAVEANAVPLLDAVFAKLWHDTWRVAPLVIVEQGRVAIGDEVGEILQAQMVAILIGERPGLSSPDSLGIYLTFQPKIGRTDAERNCISNVRREGMSYELAAHKLHYLMSEARRRRISGVNLKDESEAPRQLPVGRNFLTGIE